MNLKKEFKELGKDINKVEKNIQKDILNVEKWVIARRKFLIKLTWVVGLVAVLLIFSHVYLRTFGYGV